MAKPTVVLQLTEKQPIKRDGGAPIGSFIDVEAHVLPLLRLAQWAAEAGDTLSQIKGAEAHSPALKQQMDECLPHMTFPPDVNSCGLVGPALWVAIDLLERQQAGQEDGAS